jgi:RNA polymerase sigma-70 factor (ECF subfamily)
MDSSRTSSETRFFLARPTELGWQEFVDRYGPRILTWCRRRGLDHHASEDVTQEVLRRLHRFMGTYKPEKSFRGWLYKVTLHAIRDYLAAARKGQLLDSDNIEALANHVDDGAAYVARKDTLAVAMERTRAALPSRQWQVFEMYVLKGVSYDELEANEQLDRPTLMNYVSNARRKLKVEMGRLDGDE